MDFDGVKFYLEEIYRFPNLPVEASGTTYWDVLSLWREIQSGIAKSGSVNSLGVDSWGVDFALLDCHGKLLSNPLHYRDKCSEGMMEWVFQRVSRKILFAKSKDGTAPLHPPLSHYPLTNRLLHSTAIRHSKPCKTCLLYTSPSPRD